MAHRLVWCWWRFIRWRIVLCNADGSLSDGASSFLMVEMSHLSVVLVVLYRMAQSLVRFWWRFIRWRTVSSGAGETFRRRNVLSGAGGALSYGTPSLPMLVALHQMAHLLFWWWRCWWWLSIRWRKALLGGCGALSDGTHFCLALVKLRSVTAT